MKKILILALLIFANPAYADRASLSEGNSRGNSQSCNQECHEYTCADFLSEIKVEFDIDEEGGAHFEKYVNPNNPSEVGYRTCAPQCGIVFAGKCSADGQVTPTPTPAPKCNYYKGTLNTPNDRKNGKNNFQSSNNSGVSCVDDIINNIGNECTKRYGNTKHTYYRDDCMAVALTNKFFNGVNPNKYEKTAYYKSDLQGDVTANSGTCTAADFFSHAYNTQYSSDSKSRNNVCLSGHFYFDGGCNPVSESKVKEICGDLDVTFKASFEWSTPISLIWEKDYDVNSEVTFAKFALNMNDSAWYAWKASDKAPLLVYDPSHTGNINNASQLFGNWTFGGKRTASLNSDTQVAAGKWDNGFEALSSLDRDFDGRLSGDELSELALWFDNNRDGISQKGEVKTLAEANVTALFFDGYTTDANGDLRLNVGYEREVNGKVEQGAAVDWKEVGAPSKLALADYFTKLSDKQVATPIQPLKANSDDSQFVGTWKWSIDDASATEDSPTNGTFVINARPNGEVAGFSFAERKFADSPDGRLNSFVTMNRIYGAETDKGVLDFSAQVGNSYTDNHAILSADGNSMKGETEVYIAGNQTISYTWTAVRK